jgi:hypothetical protein
MTDDFPSVFGLLIVASLLLKIVRYAFVFAEGFFGSLVL